MSVASNPDSEWVQKKSVALSLIPCGLGLAAVGRTGVGSGGQNGSG